MKKESANKVVFDDHLGCFGDFCIGDLICKKFCALNLRCAIESCQYDHMEFLEDMVYADDMFMKVN
ncbi:hypothetical protein QUF80_17810 [Desulfococcaceae bacterium HSG8]|nr:hypothetical protein [Desulfococcaceae bacterium HSG8]